jgi:hypothetical protein
LSFRDDGEAQKHRIDALEDELEAARAEAERLREERDAALAKPVATPKKLTAGSAVWVEWNGKWWRGTVLQVLGGSLWQIHYDGWSSRWDEPVGPARIAPFGSPPPGPQAGIGGGAAFAVVGVMVVVVIAVIVWLGISTRSSAPSAYASPATVSYDGVPSGARPFDPSVASVGDPVWVSWNGTWYPSTIVAVESSTSFRIHYDGWSDSSDESVGIDRLYAR